jgi:hypothetical protein
VNENDFLGAVVVAHDLARLLLIRPETADESYQSRRDSASSSA